MVRVCLYKGVLIESQSGGFLLPMTKENEKLSKDEFIATQEKYRQNQLNVLKQNAINVGLEVVDIDVKFVSEIEFEGLLNATHAEPTYAELRAKAYPPIGDQLDAIWKELEPRHPEAIAMKKKINDVKLEIPKE